MMGTVINEVTNGAEKVDTNETKSTVRNASMIEFPR